MRELFSKRNRVILYELVKTDFKLRYQGSFLGVVWSVLKPLMLFAVMYMVFVHFLKFSDGTKTYPVVLLLGVALWSFFTEATTIGMRSIVARGDILRKINFPKYIIILSSIVNACISLIINLLVVIIFAFIIGVQFTGNIVWVPLNLMQLFIIAFGFSLILSTLYVKFRDISHIYEVILQILFYAMPIIYPVSLIVDRHIFTIPVSNLMLINPVAQAIQDIRHNLIAPETTSTVWNIIDTVWIALVPVCLSALVLCFGIFYFKKHSKKFAENI